MEKVECIRSRVHHAVTTKDCIYDIDIPNQKFKKYIGTCNSELPFDGTDIGKSFYKTI